MPVLILLGFAAATTIGAIPAQAQSYDHGEQAIAAPASGLSSPVDGYAPPDVFPYSDAILRYVYDDRAPADGDVELEFSDQAPDPDQQGGDLADDMFHIGPNVPMLIIG